MHTPMPILDVSHIKQSIISILDANNQVTGYGFFIDPHGMAITCYHLISNQPTIRIRDHDGQEYNAVINKYYSSLRNDIAVIHIQKSTLHFLLFSHRHITPDEVTEIIISPDKTTWEFSNIESTKCGYHLRTNGMHGLPLFVPDSLKVIGIKMSDRYSNMTLLHVLENTGQFELLRQYLSDKYCREKLDQKASEIKTIFNLQVHTAINDLIDKGIFLPEYYCSRDEEKRLQSFHINKGHLYLLTGDNSIGKTSLLAHTASTFTRDRHVLFFPAWQLELHANGLKGEIKRILQHTLADHPQSPVTINDLMSVLEGCTIFIDGLNEISNQFSGRFNSWIKHSLGWARNMNIKLIISSTKPVNNQLGIKMGSFNVKQTDQAFLLYNLPEKFKVISRLSHPFLIRLLHDISSQAVPTLPDDYPLVATFIQRKCAAVARLTNIPSGTIHSLLIDLASHSENHWLSHNMYQDLLKDHPDLVPILIQENLFIQSNNGIRITFAWIGEFLTSESLKLDLPWDQLNPTQRKGFPWLVAKYSFQKKNVSPVMQHLLSSITNNHPEKEKAVDIFINTVQHLSNPDQHYPTIEAFTLHEQTGFFLPHEVGPLVYHSHLSFPNQLKLIKIALSTETLGPNLIHFFFSCHIYYDKNLLLEPNSPFSTKQALYRYLYIQRDKTLDIIMQWLYDYDGVSVLPMINVIACIILHQFYGFGKTRKTFLDVRNKIFVNYKKQDNSHLAPIIKELSSLIVASSPEFEDDLRQVCFDQVTHISFLRKKDNYQNYIKWLPPVILDIVRKTTSLENKIAGIRWLIRVPEYQREMLDQVLILLKENKLHFRNCQDIFSYIDMEEYFDIVMPELVSFIKHGTDRNSRKMCIAALFQFQNNEEQNVVLAQQLALLIDEVPELDRKLTQQFVAALVKVPYHSKAYPILHYLIPKLLPRDLHIWYPILKYLCRAETCVHKLSDKIKWIRWAFKNMEPRPLCTLTILLLNTKVIKDEDQILVLIKPVILHMLESSDQFYDAVLKKCAKKNLALFHDILNDEDFKRLT